MATSTKTRTASKTTTPAEEAKAPEPTVNETGHGDTLAERSISKPPAETPEAPAPAAETEPEAPQEPTPEEPAKLTAMGRKTLLSTALLRAAGDMLDAWDSQGESTQGVTQDEAREQFAAWLKYVRPRGEWDSRLGPDPAAK